MAGATCLLTRLHHLARAGDSELSDSELLRAYVLKRDEAAFTALVRRHGPMVLGVSRRLLRHDSDAEDVFQATFLILARKASTLTDPARLPGWLHGVAYRTALRARRETAAHWERERAAALPEEVAPEEEWVWQDLRRVLDEEIARLPEKQRTAVVLCYLQGKTNVQAARLLNWPVGTVATRLARAREQLRRRLTQRGIAPAAVATLGSLAFAQAASARVSPLVVGMAARMGRCCGTRGIGTGGVTARVAALAQGGGKMGLGSILQVILTGMLATGVLGLGAKASHEQQTIQPEQKAQPVSKSAPSDAPREQEETLRFHCEKLQRNPGETRIWANEPGSVQILTRTGPGGELLDKPVVVEVRWEKHMMCGGNWLECEGDVQLQYGPTCFKSERLRLLLARKVSLTSSRPEKGPVPLASLRMTENCRVETLHADPQSGLVVTRLASCEIWVDFKDRNIKVFGPGQLRLRQPESPVGQPQMVRVDFREQACLEWKKDKTEPKPGAEVSREAADKPIEGLNETSREEDLVVEAGDAILTVQTRDKGRATLQLEARGSVVMRTRRDRQEYLGQASGLSSDLGDWYRLWGATDKPAVLITEHGATRDSRIQADRIRFNLRTGNVGTAGTSELKK